MHYFPRNKSGVLVPRRFIDDLQASAGGDCAKKCENSPHSALKLVIIAGLMTIIAAITTPVATHLLTPEASTPQSPQTSPSTPKPLDGKKKTLIFEIEVPDTLDEGKLRNDQFNQDLHDLIQRHHDRKKAPDTPPNSLPEPSGHIELLLVDQSTILRQNMTILDLIVPNSHLGSEVLFALSPDSIAASKTTGSIFAVTGTDGKTYRVISERLEDGSVYWGLDSCTIRYAQDSRGGPCMNNGITSSDGFDIDSRIAITETFRIPELLISEEELDIGTPKTDIARTVGSRNLADIIIYKHYDKIYASKRGDLITAVTLNTLDRYVPAFLLSLLLTYLIGSYAGRRREEEYSFKA